MKMDTNPLNSIIHPRVAHLDATSRTEHTTNSKSTRDAPYLYFDHISLCTPITEFPSDGIIMKIMCAFKGFYQRSEPR